MSNYMNPYMNPYGQRPMWQQPGTPQMPARQLLRVSGINGAKAFQMNPNEVVALFDEGDDILQVLVKIPSCRFKSCFSHHRKIP